MPKPIIVLITSRQCGHCVHFRGEDGKPTSDKEWSPELIRKLLTGSPLRKVYSSLRASAIIEIHLSSMNVNADNIIQINEYSIEKDLSILRVSITRREGDKVTYSAELDGVPSTSLSSKFQILFENETDFHKWEQKHIPSKIKQLVPFFPVWMFVNPIEWEQSIEYNSPISAYVVSATVSKNDDGSFSSEPNDVMEDPNEALTKFLHKNSYLN